MHKTPYYIYILLNSAIKLPSTFLHEIAHVVVALLLGCRVKGFSIFPKIEDEGFITFGQVQVGARFPGVLFLVGLAPIIWNIIAFFIYIYDVIIINKFITYAVILCLISAGIPSYQDTFLAFKGLISFSGAIIAALLILVIITFYYAIQL